MTELEQVKERIALIIEDAIGLGMELTPTVNLCVDSILSDPNIAILSSDQTLPEIPEFQYDKAEDRPLLKRGAINYSKMLTGWRKVVLK
jgi:hypothetical protein